MPFTETAAIRLGVDFVRDLTIRPGPAQNDRVSRLARHRGLWLALLLVALVLAGPAHAGLHPADGDCQTCHVDLQALPVLELDRTPQRATEAPELPVASRPATTPVSSETTRGPPSSEN